MKFSVPVVGQWTDNSRPQSTKLLPNFPNSTITILQEFIDSNCFPDVYFTLEALMNYNSSTLNRLDVELLQNRRHKDSIIRNICLTITSTVKDFAVIEPSTRRIDRRYRPHRAEPSRHIISKRPSVKWNLPLKKMFFNTLQKLIKIVNQIVVAENALISRSAK